MMAKEKEKKENEEKKKMMAKEKEVDTKYRPFCITFVSYIEVSL